MTEGVDFMLIKCSSHVEFQQFLRQQIPLLWALEKDRVQSFSRSLTKVWLLNLEPAIPLLFRCFSSLGRPVLYDPVCILRSLVLMLDLGCHSVTKWASALRSDSILAVLSGFEPDKTPAVGTFYDFFDKLWLEDREARIKRRLKLRAPVKKPRKQLKAGVKQPVKHPGVVGKLAKKVMDGRTPFPLRAEKLIQEIFARCFVDVSIHIGLIPDPLELVLSGDGSSLRTGSSPHGVKVCVCRKNGVFNCDCGRRLSDPEASWGWDSYRNVYYYGYSMYVLTAASSVNELPMYIRLVQAGRHDSVTGIVSLAEFRDIYPSLGFSKFLADSAHDAYPYYELMKFWDVEPFIDLNSKGKGNFKNLPSVSVNEFGIPICPKGYAMCFCGFNKSRNRLKWRCPLKAGSRRLRKNISCDCPCSDSPYGRTVYTKPQDDLRIFTKTPRNSKAWRKEYAKRSSSERSFKRIKNDYEIERSRVRSRKNWYFFLHFAAMNCHLDAWVDKAEREHFNIWHEVLGVALAA